MLKSGRVEPLLCINGAGHGVRDTRVAAGGARLERVHERLRQLTHKCVTTGDLKVSRRLVQKHSPVRTLAFWVVGRSPLRHLGEHRVSRGFYFRHRVKDGTSLTLEFCPCGRYQALMSKMQVAPVDGLLREQKMATTMRLRIAAVVSAVGLAIALCVLLSSSQPTGTAMRTETGAVRTQIWQGAVSPKLEEEADLSRAEERVLGIKAELGLRQKLPASTTAAGDAAAHPTSSFVQEIPKAGQSNKFVTLSRPSVEAPRTGGRMEEVRIPQLVSRAENKHTAYKIGGWQLNSLSAERREQPGRHPGRSLIAPQTSREWPKTDSNSKQNKVDQDWRPEARQTMNTHKASEERADEIVALRLNQLARVERSEQPAIREWREEQSAKWGKEKIVLAQKEKSSSEQQHINEDLKQEARQIGLWRRQEQRATRKMVEKRSAKVEYDKVRKARSEVGHEQRVRLQQEAASKEIQTITREEMREWSAEKKGQAVERMAKRMKARAFDKLRQADGQIVKRLKAEPASTQEFRKQRKVPHVEWKEDQVRDDVKAAVHLERENRRLHQQADNLARHRANKQWENLVKMARGDSTRESSLEGTSGSLKQNLAAYLTSGPDQPAIVDAKLDDQNEISGDITEEKNQERTQASDSLKQNDLAAYLTSGPEQPAIVDATLRDQKEVCSPLQSCLVCA